MGMIKTPKEIRNIKRAAYISNLCIKVIEKSLKEDITERELAHRVRKEINRHGATLSFQTLVGTGSRSSMIHTKPRVTDNKISGMGYIDFGVRYNGYCSDVTVPFVKGKIGSGEKAIIKLVLEAYNSVIKSIGVGNHCWKLHDEVNMIFRKHGFRMQHALGHGIGAKVHEMPLIVKPRKRLRGKRKQMWEKIKRITFQPGMAFAIEPAIYTKNFGFRIENDFLLGSKLTKLTNARLIVVK